MATIYYKNPTNGQVTANDVADFDVDHWKSQGWTTAGDGLTKAPTTPTTSQFSSAPAITRQPNEGPVELVQRIQNQTAPAATGERLLGPAEYANLRTQYGATPETFDKWFRKDANGNIYLKAQGTATPAPTAAAPTGERLLGPTEYENLRKQFGSTPETFDQHFRKDEKGNIYLKGSTPTPSETPTPDSGTQPAPTDQPAPIVQTSAAERAKLRKEEIARIKAELEGDTEKPQLYKSSEEFDRLRKEQGVVQDEEELSSLQNESRLINQEIRELSARAGEGVSEGGRLGIMSEAQRNANFKLEGLAIRQQAVVSRLNSKNAYINAAIKLGQEDYDTAYKNYTEEFNKNLKAIDLYNQELDDQQKDALTGFTTIANLIGDKNIDFSKNPALSQQLDTFALKLGLEPGLFQSVIADSPQQKILSPMVVDTPAGKDVYFFTQGPDGMPTLKKVESLPGTPDVVGTEKTGKYAYNSKTGKYDILISGPTGSGSGSTKGSFSSSAQKDIDEFKKQMDENYRGSDGFYDTAAFKYGYANFAAKYPAEAEKFLKAFPPNAVLNPNDPTAIQFFGVKPKIE